MTNAPRTPYFCQAAIDKGGKREPSRFANYEAQSQLDHRIGSSKPTTKADHEIAAAPPSHLGPRRVNPAVDAGRGVWKGQSS